MSFENEKRSCGERRQINSGVPPTYNERRRMADRREFAIEDIPFLEWANQFAKYYKACAASQGAGVSALRALSGNERH